jgi:hypothetical protein
MRPHLTAGVLALVLLAPAAAADPKSAWESDYEKARRTAREAGKPMLVVLRCEA